MADKRLPDGRLVYLHCSSIFSGANAQIRKAKKISQLLQKHKGSIKILTKEFTLPAIAAVAKDLLEELIFESLSRARLRYPELFQPSETQEAERAASEAEVLKIEAEAAQNIVLTSDDDGEKECLDFDQDKKRAEFKITRKDKIIASKADQANNVHVWQFYPDDNFLRENDCVAKLIDSTVAHLKHKKGPPFQGYIPSICRSKRSMKF